MSETKNLAPPDPFIISLRLDEASFAYLDGLRRRYFPPERNLLAAHVTLFHALPGDVVSEAVIRRVLESVCEETDPFDVTLQGLRSLGSGVAVEVHSESLLRLRSRLAGEFGQWLTPQDRQKFQPHVTIQNKVTPETAKELLRTLAADWQPRVAHATGLRLSRYRGGPWEGTGTFLFLKSFESGLNPSL